MPQASLRIGQQHSLQSITSPQKSMVKIGKVLSVHREDHSVDLVFLDGNVVTQVPVLTSGLGSNFGLVNMVAPSYDPDQLAKKTYPETQASAVHSAANTSKVGRDLYALILQAEGNLLGTAKMAVVGFLPPQVSEMLFARHEISGSTGAQAASAELEGEFDDFMLYRHPADVQVTMDKKGKLSIQHPNGSRITMGEDVGGVDLTKKDYDKRYELRHNLHTSVSIYIEAVDDGGTKRADVLISAGGEIEATVYDSGGVKIADLVLSDQGTLTGAVYSGGEQQTARVKLEQEGNAEVYALKEVNAHNGPGCFMILKASGSAEMHATGQLKLSAGGQVLITGATIKGTAGRIDWN